MEIKENTLYHIKLFLDNDRKVMERWIMSWDGREWWDSSGNDCWNMEYFKSHCLLGPEVVFPPDSEYKPIE